MVKSKKQLCQEYNVSYSTLKKWLQQVPDLIINKHSQLFNPQQLDKIYTHLGRP